MDSDAETNETGMETDMQRHRDAQRLEYTHTHEYIHTQTQREQDAQRDTFRHRHTDTNILADTETTETQSMETHRYENTDISTLAPRHGDAKKRTGIYSDTEARNCAHFCQRFLMRLKARDSGFSPRQHVPTHPLGPTVTFLVRCVVKIAQART